MGKDYTTVKASSAGEEHTVNTIGDTEINPVLDETTEHIEDDI